MIRSLISDATDGIYILRNEGISSFSDSARNYLSRKSTTAINQVADYGYATAYDILDLYCDWTLATTTSMSGGRSVGFNGKEAVSTMRSDNNICIWNISDPKHPEISNQISIQEPNHVVTTDEYGYVTQRSTGAALHVVDLSKQEITSSATLDSFPLTYGIDIDTDREIAAVADRSGGVATIDISDHDDITYLDTLSAPQLEGATQLAIIGKYILVGGKDSFSLVTIDCSDPYDLQVANILSDDRLVLVDGLTHHDGYLYTAAGSLARTTLTADCVNWQMNILDISNPTSPEFIGQNITEQLGKCYGLCFQNNTLYASSRLNNQIVAVDVSNPSNPTIQDINHGLEHYRVHWIDIVDDLGVSVSTDGRLTVFDVSSA